MAPVTRSDLLSALAELGVRQGDTLCVHTSMSRIGRVMGGAQTVIAALIEATGPQGTLMMPAYTRDCAHPNEWQYPPAPPEWIARADETPAFDPRLTPSVNCGAVAELFRTWPGAIRSRHPISSVAALGPLAERLTHGVPLDNRFGPASPYGRLYDIGGKVLMLGAPYETMSLLHLTEYLLAGGRLGQYGKPVVKTARTESGWVEFNDVLLPHAWAEACVGNMVSMGHARVGFLGQGRLLCVEARTAVDYAMQWRRAHEPKEEEQPFFVMT